jgi:hypothetical protein
MSKNIIRKGFRRTAFLIAHQKFRISDGVTGLANVKRDHTWNLIGVLIYDILDVYNFITLEF